MRLKKAYTCLLLCLSATLQAANYTPQSVPDPKTRGNRHFVANPDGIISAAAEQRLNEMLYSLQQRTEVEMAVVAIGAIGNADYTEFAHELFSQWKIGQAGKDNGLLLLLVADERAVRIETGYGLEGLLPDATCNRILDNHIFPAFRQGDYDGGFTAGVQQITELLTTQAALEELLLDRPPRQQPFVSILMLYLMLAFAVWIALVWYTYKASASNGAANNVRYQRLLAPYRCSALCAILFPLPVAIFAYWLRRRRETMRRQPVRCNECGATMALLTEQEEDRLLTQAQQAEENVKSVDYDVWECKSCLNHIILPYEQLNSQYAKCPQCHAKTYGLYADVVRQRATQLHEGTGEKTYLCRHCHYRQIKTYSIPKQPVVVASGGRTGGGGLSGGSWGGGFSGGGGAGGRF